MVWQGCVQPVEGLHSVRTMAAMVAARDPHVSRCTRSSYQSVSQPTSQPVSQPANLPVSQLASQSATSQSTSQSASQPANQATSQPISHSECLVSQGCCIQVPVVFLEDQSSYMEYGAASWPLFTSAGFFGQLSSSEVTDG